MGESSTPRAHEPVATVTLWPKNLVTGREQGLGEMLSVIGQKWAGRAELPGVAAAMTDAQPTPMHAVRDLVDQLAALADRHPSSLMPETALLSLKHVRNGPVQITLDPVPDELSDAYPGGPVLNRRIVSTFRLTCECGWTEKAGITPWTATVNSVRGALWDRAKAHARDDHDGRPVEIVDGAG